MAELKISEANKDDITVWKNLQKYPAWRKLCLVKQEDLKEADEIINTLGFDRDKMFSERDVAIIKKKAILDLINYPEMMINMLSGTGTEKTEQLDAYREADEEDENDDL